MAVQRGEVYFAELGPAVGREQVGRRPVVVVSNPAINTRPLVVLIVPGTRAAKSPSSFAGSVLVPRGEANLAEDTVFMAFQAKAVDPSRFQSRPTGQLTPATMEKIERAIAWSFGLKTS